MLLSYYFLNLPVSLLCDDTLIYSFAHALTHPLTHLFTHSFIHSLTHVPTQAALEWMLSCTALYSPAKSRAPCSQASCMYRTGFPPSCTWWVSITLSPKTSHWTGRVSWPAGSEMDHREILWSTISMRMLTAIVLICGQMGRSL